jgi:hypothetical protein
MKTIVKIWFAGHRIPGGAEAILGPTHCGPDVAKVAEYEYGGGNTGYDVDILLEEGDERIAPILALLAPYERVHTVIRRDIFTEEDLQNAPLLCLAGSYDNVIVAGMHYGTTYDFSNACKQCGVGPRQSSMLVIRGDDERVIEKRRASKTTKGDLLVRDVDGEKFVQAKFTGFNLWPISSLRKGGTKVELRHEQVFVENVLPPMAPSSTLDRRKVCTVCHRGRFEFYEPERIVYRREDLQNIQDFNVTWEGFGSNAKTPEEALAGNWPDPLLLVTPRVMNFLRGKTKKEQKNLGCDFYPILIEGEEPWRK